MPCHRPSISIAALTCLLAAVSGCIGPTWLDPYGFPIDHPAHLPPPAGSSTEVGESTGARTMSDTGNDDPTNVDGTDVASGENTATTHARKHKVATNVTTVEEGTGDHRPDDDPLLAAKVSLDGDEQSDKEMTEKEAIQQLDSVALAEVYEELEAVRKLDPELHRELRRDLKQTDPAIWPLMVKNIRAALAYREDSLPGGSDGEPTSHQRPAEHQQLAWGTRNRFANDERPVNDLRTRASRPHNDLRSGSRPRRGAQPPEQWADHTTGRIDPFADEDELEAPAEEESSMGRDAGKQSITRDEKTTRQREVERAVYERELPHDDWQVPLHEAIQALENELAEAERIDTIDPPLKESTQALLRMLYLAAGQKDKAVVDIPELDEDRQQFWSNLFRALHDYLDADNNPVEQRRAERALRDLREATGSLANFSQLNLPQLAFCSRVESYGRFTEISPEEFEPDQEVLLYVEVENFAAQRTESGEYKTEFEGSYQIIDEDGDRIADHTFPMEREICRNRRRDYFIPFRMWFPKKIYPGQYTLQLTIEDKLGEKFGQASIDFAIRR